MRKVPRALRNRRDRRANLITGNDFREAKLIDVGFTGGVDLNTQHLPTGDPYLMIDDWPTARRAALRRIRKSRPREERQALELEIKVMSNFYAGQRSVWLSRLGVHPTTAAAIDELAAAVDPSA